MPQTEQSPLVFRIWQTKGHKLNRTKSQLFFTFTLYFAFILSYLYLGVKIAKNGGFINTFDY